MTPSNLRNIAFQYAEKLKLPYPAEWKKDKMVGKDWADRFMKDNPQIRFYTELPASPPRTMCFDRSTANATLESTRPHPKVTVQKKSNQKKQSEAELFSIPRELHEKLIEAKQTREPKGACSTKRSAAPKKRILQQTAEMQATKAAATQKAKRAKASPSYFKK